MGADGADGEARGCKGWMRGAGARWGIQDQDGRWWDDGGPICPSQVF